MSAKTTVLASEVWEYFQDCKEELKDHMYQIAGNTDYGIAIYVTEDSGLPSIVVTADDEQIFEETAISESDCKRTVEKIYDKYLSNAVISILTGEPDEEGLSEMEQEDTIWERELELDNAIAEFIDVAIGGIVHDNSTLDDDGLEDIKDHFLEYLYRKHGLPIFRPMMLEYDDGKGGTYDEYDEYPYENMEFDDDNQIYK